MIHTRMYDIHIMYVYIRFITANLTANLTRQHNNRKATPFSRKHPSGQKHPPCPDELALSSASRFAEALRPVRESFGGREAAAPLADEPLVATIDSANTTTLQIICRPRKNVQLRFQTLERGLCIKGTIQLLTQRSLTSIRHV